MNNKIQRTFLLVSALVLMTFMVHLVPGLYGFTLSNGLTIRVSVNSGGAQGNGNSYNPAISGDGRYVAFDSWSTNLVSDDTNNTKDVFVHDRQTGETGRVSIASDGSQGNNASGSHTPSISDDGRFVAFQSYATNFDPADTNSAADIFVHDRQNGETKRISVSSDGTQANDHSWYPEISGNGQFVVFTSQADNLVANDTNNSTDIFIHDLQSGETILVSLSSDEIIGNGNSDNASVSNGGRYVSFDSLSNNLVVDDTNEIGDVFVRDILLGDTIRVSVSNDGVESNGVSEESSISDDGSLVAFASEGFNLVNNDTNNVADIFVNNWQLGEVVRVSVASDGSQGNRVSLHTSLSGNGRYISFRSDSSNLVPNDTNSAFDVFVHDLFTLETIRVSVDSNGSQGDSGSQYPAISDNGLSVTFHSFATDLVEDDTNARWDVFVHEYDATVIFSISGNIQDSDSNLPIEGVIVSTDTGESAVTDALGEYIIEELTGGEYILTAQKDGYIFTPATQTVNVPPNRLNINFVGTQAYSITGRVTDGQNGLPIENVIVSTNTGESTVTDSLGMYAMQNIAAGTFDILAQKDGIYFLSELRTISLPPSRENINFVGIPLAHYRPNLHGYQFENKPAFASFDVFEETFGSSSNTSLGRTFFEDFYVPLIKGGGCSGVATSSMLLWRGSGWVEPEDFLITQNVEYAFQLEPPQVENGFWVSSDLSDFIMKYQGYQLGLEISLNMIFNRWWQAPVDIANDIVESINNSLDDPYAIAVFGTYKGEPTGHALVPFAYEKQGDIFQIYVYDPNHPGSTSQKIEIDMVSNSWSYNHNNEIAVWGTGLPNADIVAQPLNLWREPPTPRWLPLAYEGDNQLFTVRVNEAGYLLLVDEQNRRLGYLQDGILVNEIPNALPFLPVATIPDLRPEYPEVYSLTDDIQFDITVTYTDTTELVVSQMYPGTFIEIAGNASQTGMTDTLTISSELEEVLITSGSDGENRSVVVVSQQDSRVISSTISDFTLGLNDTALIDVNSDNETQKLEYFSDNFTQYNVSFSNIDEVTLNEISFSSNSIEFNAGDRHIVSLDWSNPTIALLEIDYGNDGTIDEIIILNGRDNWMSYLPVLLRP